MIESLPHDSKVALELNIEEWRDRKRTAASHNDTSEDDADVVLPPGPGEWDEPLGVPLCVAAHNADKIETLETNHNWKDAQFDFITQYLRTVLLKHGASLIYTMPSAAAPLQTLLHASLDIHSPLQTRTTPRQLRHNITDRDTVLVPPGWDSWSRIRILADGFDVEAVSKAWSHDIATPEQGQGQDEDYECASVSMYAETIKDPRSTAAAPAAKPDASAIDVPTRDTQAFLAEQADALRSYAAEDDRDKLVRDAKKAPSASAAAFVHSSSVTTAEDRSNSGRDIEDHIGPVQFNMGGIQVDADEVVRRLKVCYNTFQPALTTCLPLC